MTTMLQFAPGGASQWPFALSDYTAVSQCWCPVGGNRKKPRRQSLRIIHVWYIYHIYPHLPWFHHSKTTIHVGKKISVTSDDMGYEAMTSNQPGSVTQRWPKSMPMFPGSHGCRWNVPHDVYNLVGKYEGGWIFFTPPNLQPWLQRFISWHKNIHRRSLRFKNGNIASLLSVQRIGCLTSLTAWLSFLMEAELWTSHEKNELGKKTAPNFGERWFHQDHFIWASQNMMYCIPFYWLINRDLYEGLL